MKRAIFDGTLDYKDFLEFWERSWSYRNTNLVIGRTNLQMGKFAVKRLNFKFVCEESLKDKTPHDQVVVYGYKKDLLQKKPFVDQLAKRIHQRS